MCKVGSVLWTQGISWPLWPAVFCESKASADRCGQLCSAVQNCKATLLLLLIRLVYVGVGGPLVGQLWSVACSLQQSAHRGAGCSPTPFALSTWILCVPACCVLCVLSVYFVCRLLIIFGFIHSLLALAVIPFHSIAFVLCLSCPSKTPRCGTSLPLSVCQSVTQC